MKTDWMKFTLWVVGLIVVVPAIIVMLTVLGFFGLLAMVAK